MTVLRHSRQHHRITHRRWARRRKILLTLLYPWRNTPADYDTHFPSHMLGKKPRRACHIEEKQFRQQVRKALWYDEPMPRYRHEYAD